MFNESKMQQAARDHLWLHFSRMGIFDREQIPIITHGEGCYVFDSNGKRYLDGLAGLFTSQLGHGRSDIAAAVADQIERLGFFSLWGYAHPGAIELAQKLATIAPGDLNRVFFTSGGGESVEAAWKLARQYFAETGEPRRFKAISRNFAYHGTSLGALTLTGATPIKTMFEPLVPGGCHVENTDSYRGRHAQRGLAGLSLGKEAAADIERAIEIEGPDTVAAVILEPVQNVGGCLVPPEGYFEEVRRICDHYGILLISDEVICGFGRLGQWFGCERFEYQPDIITCAKGLTSGMVPMGAMICSERLFEPFTREEAQFQHGTTFGGHPVAAAAAIASIKAMEQERICENVRANEQLFRGSLEKLLDLSIVGDVRGAGYFYGIELTPDRQAKGTFDPEQEQRLLFDFISPRLLEEGLICRTDDRACPVIQLSPPLIAGEREISEIADVLYRVLSEANERLKDYK